MIEFFQKLFDTSDFPARWYCGNWSAGVGWLHIVSDIATFGAYVAIPCVLIWFLRKRQDIVFPRVFWLFAAFIAACGSVHLIEAVIFWHPIYRFSGLMKCFTAIVSWATVVAVVRIAPSALRLPSLLALNARLETEVEERRKVEERLNSILNSMSDGVMVSDCEGNLELLNPAARSIFQFDDCDLSYSERFKRYTVNSADGQHRLIGRELPLQRAGAGESIDNVELLIRCVSKGVNASIVLSARPVHDVNDELSGAVAVFRDVTSLNRERSARQMSEARLTAIVDSMSDGVAVATLDGTLEMVNPAAEQILGIGHVDVESDEWSKTYGLYRVNSGELIPADELPLMQALTGVPKSEMEMVVRNSKLKEEVTIAARATPILNHQDQLIGAVAVFHDVTKAKQIENERTEHIEQLEHTTAIAATVAAATQCAPDDDKPLLSAIASELQVNWVSLATYTTNECVDWRCLDLSSGTETRCRIPMTEWNQIDCDALTTQLLRLDTLEALESQVKNVALAGLRIDGHTRGALMVSRRESVLTDDELEVLRRFSQLAAPAIFIRQQLAETEKQRQVIEAQLRESRDHADQLARVNSLGEITAGISHELNQPLTAIVNFTDEAHAMTKEELTENSLKELSLLTKKACEQASRAGGILRSIRSVIRRSTGHVEKFDLLALIRETVELLPRQSKGVEIQVETSSQSDAIMLKADRTQIQQVLINLIQNAVDATAGQQQKKIVICATQTAEKASVSVTDTGCGIDEPDVERVFDAFYTTGSGGLGLGLKICRTILELHGGHIELYNNKDAAGATFVVTLPKHNTCKENVA